MPGAAAGSGYTPAPIGNGSLVINGQIIPVPMGGQFYPAMASAPFYKGSGQPPPTLPVNYMQGTGGPDAQAAATAAGNPWSPTLSPLIIAIVALVVGIVGLRLVHWR